MADRCAIHRRRVDAGRIQRIIGAVFFPARGIPVADRLHRRPADADVPARAMVRHHAQDRWKDRRQDRRQEFAAAIAAVRVPADSRHAGGEPMMAEYTLHFLGPTGTFTHQRQSSRQDDPPIRRIRDADTRAGRPDDS
mgnify:CR=1 FL=1